MDYCRYISICGAGTKYGLLCGGLLCFIDNLHIYGNKTYEDWRNELKGLAGCSAGSFIALAIILGITKEDLHELSNINLQIGKALPCPNIGLILDSYGLEDGKGFKQTIMNYLIKYGLHENTTLGDIKRLLNKEFVCITTNSTTQEEYILSSTKTPNVRVCDAIYMSCCIPFIYTPEKYNGHYLYDGSFIMNQPNVFPERETLFLTMDIEKTNMVVDSWKKYLYNVITCSITLQKRIVSKYLKDNNFNYITFSSCENINKMTSFELNVDNLDSQLILYSGYASVLNYYTKNKLYETIIKCVKLLFHINETNCIDDI